MAQKKVKRSSFQAKPFGELLSNDVKLKTIDELKNLLEETIQLDVALHREYYKIEKDFEKDYHELYDKRLELLKNCQSEPSGDSIAKRMQLNIFWIKVLKASLTKLISKADEQILKYLIDIRTRMFNTPSVKFIILFHFEPNVFFANRILTKTYYVKSLPDNNDPLLFEGEKIWKCEGCHIEWNEKLRAKLYRNSSSFFDFFSPPVLPDSEDLRFEDVESILKQDYKLGFYFKERIVPKAVMFFTGEIEEFIESSDSEDFQEEQVTRTKPHIRSS